MQDFTISKFIELTASKAPTPGGGGVAALTASSGIALVSMLANLTIGKKDYVAVQDKMQEVAKEATKEAKDLLEFIDEDAGVFNKYMDAIKMPKATDEDIVLRRKAMQEAIIDATMVPLNLARKAYQLMDLADYVVGYGYKGAISDGAVGALLLRSATLAALYNVRINLPSIEDQSRREAIKIEADAIEKGAQIREQAILAAAKLD